MTEEQVSGMQRFEQVGASSAHGPMFSDYKLHVMGVPTNPALPAPTTARRKLCLSHGVAAKPAFTAPYEHNGMFRTLSDVVGSMRRPRRALPEPNVSSEKLDPLIRELGTSTRRTWIWSSF